MHRCTCTAVVKNINGCVPWVMGCSVTSFCISSVLIISFCNTRLLSYLWECIHWQGLWLLCSHTCILFVILPQMLTCLPWFTLTNVPNGGSIEIESRIFPPYWPLSSEQINHLFKYTFWPVWTILASLLRWTISDIQCSKSTLFIAN